MKGLVIIPQLALLSATVIITFTAIQVTTGLPEKEDAKCLIFVIEEEKELMQFPFHQQ